MSDTYRAGFIRLTEQPSDSAAAATPLLVRPQLIDVVFGRPDGTQIRLAGLWLHVVESLDELLDLIDPPRDEGELRLDAETVETLADFAAGPAMMLSRHNPKRVRFLERVSLIERAGLTDTSARGHRQMYRATDAGRAELAKHQAPALDAGTPALRQAQGEPKGVAA